MKWANQALASFAQHHAVAGVQVVVNGAEYDEALISSMAASAISQLGEKLSTKIGQAGDLSTRTADYGRRRIQLKIKSYPSV
jgi:6,7-dimethyl-8-ribityllumazine synthase